MAGHMAPTRSSSDGSSRGLRRSGDDAFQLTIDYLKQETVGPLKGLGKFLQWGIAGSFCLALGVLLLLIGLLRVLQTETSTALTGNWSWVPYFAVLFVGAIVMGIAAWRITAGPAKRKVPRGSVDTREITPTPEIAQHEEGTNS
jgi:Putative Actinobacterial Holin-X, holin superfamily III